METVIAIGAGLGVIILIALNVAVTVGISKDDTVTGLQKTAHIVVIWLLPIIGGVISLGFLATHHQRDEMKSLVPFPFYLAAAKESGEANAAFSASDNFPEGVCGDD